MTQPIEAVLVGAGGRGYYAYGPYALQHPEQIRFTAVAEPNEERRLRFAADHDIPAARQFHSWEELYDRGQIADVLLNCTLDRTHLESTLPALELGYNVLLEKPMSNTLAGNVSLVQAAERNGRLLMICHVLR
jgi:predicted dehydrogenase